MSNVTWRDFHEYVMPSVEGCPLGMANTAIKSAVIEFCEKSLLWKLESRDTDIIAGEARYGFSPPEGTHIVQTVFASINDRPLVMTCLDDLDNFHTGWREREERDPHLYYMDTDNTIRLVGIPTETLDKALEVHVALKPSRDAQGCPKFIHEGWAEGIAHGALMRLHAMVGKPWSSPTLVQYHRNLFRSAISRAKSKAMKSRQAVTKTILPRKFGDF